MFWDESVAGWKFAYNTAGDGYTIGAALPVSTGTLSINGYLAVGTDPTDDGIIRIPNAEIIKARNSTNSGNLSLIQGNTNNQVELGSASVAALVPQNLFVGQTIEHATAPAAGQALTGFIRVSNEDLIIAARDNGDSGDLEILKTIMDNIVMGSSRNTGITYNMKTSNLHSFQENSATILEIRNGFVRFTDIVNNPTIYQTDQTIGNGQPLSLLAQNTTDVTGYGGLLVLGSGSGSRDGAVEIRTAGVTKLTVFSDNAIYPTDNDSILSSATTFRFNTTLISPVIKQDDVTGAGAGQDFLIQASR
jgi:hypothetical protein